MLTGAKRTYAAGTAWCSSATSSSTIAATSASGVAGQGPTHLVADRHGRMIATDTRGNQVLVFQPNPSGPPTQVGVVPQPGGPYGITYDAVRDRLWVASSGTNEVIGYDMTDPQPRPVARVATVQNPYTLGVDQVTGRLFVAGVTGGVIQVISP